MSTASCSSLRATYGLLIAAALGAACGRDSAPQGGVPASGGLSDDANSWAGDGNSSIGTVVDGKFVLSPAGEEGPFWVDENLNRLDVTTDTATGAAQAGAPLALGLKVFNVVNNQPIPLSGAVVDIWQANAAGKYSDEQSEGTVGQSWLRGHQIADATGLVQFKSIVPGWYGGRTTHVHVRVRVYPAGNSSTPSYNWTTQLFFPDSMSDAVYQGSPYSAHAGRDTHNSNDHVYKTQCTSGGQTFDCGKLMMLDLTEAEGGHRGTGSIYVDTSTPSAQSTGSAGGMPSMKAH